MLALIYSDLRRTLWVAVLKYRLFFTGAAVTLTLVLLGKPSKTGNTLLDPPFLFRPYTVCGRTHRVFHVIRGRCYRRTYRKRASMHRGLGVIDRLHDPIYQCDGSDLLSRHCTVSCRN